MIVFLTIATLSISTIYLYFKHIYQYWARRSIPFVRIRFPYGNFRPVALKRSSIGETYLHLYRKLKTPWRRYVGVYFFNNPELMILDPELVKTVLMTDWKYFEEGPKYHDEKNDVLRRGVKMEDEKWREMKKKLTEMCSQDSLKMIFPTLISSSLELDIILQQHVEQSEAIDLKELASRFTTDIISSCFYGFEANSLRNPNDEFHSYRRKLFETTSWIWTIKLLSYFAPQLCKKLKLTRVNKNTRQYFLNITRKIILHRKKKNIVRNDFLQLLINDQNFDKNSEETIETIAEVLCFLSSGLEATSSTLTFCLYELAMDPEIQFKVGNEIREMLNKYEGNLTYESITELQYLDNVINETMRLHSAIPILQRKCIKPYRIPNSDVLLKKGTTLILPVIGYHTDPEYYPNPLKHDLDRFDSQEKEKNNSSTFLPFGGSSNLCMGSRLSMLLIKVFLVSLLKNHRLTLHKKTKTPVQMDPKYFISSIQGGVWVSVERL